MSLKSSLLAGAFALIAGFLSGYWLCHTQWKNEESRINESQARQETERLRKALDENRTLNETVSQLQIKNRKENDNAKKKYDDLLARINRGAVRVSVPARACGELSNSKRTNIAGRQTRAELDPAIVERILSVGRDGDAAIRDLNVCIDQYRNVAQMYEKKQQ